MIENDYENGGRLVNMMAAVIEQLALLREDFADIDRKLMINFAAGAVLGFILGRASIR